MKIEEIDRTSAIELLAHHRLGKMNDEEKTNLLLSFWPPPKELWSSMPFTSSIDVDADDFEFDLPQNIYSMDYSPILIFGISFEYIGATNEFLASEILDFLNKKIIVAEPIENMYACFCCGYKSLNDRGEYSICEVCGWEDENDEVSMYLGYGEMGSGPNYMTLSEGRERFAKTGHLFKENDPKILLKYLRSEP